MIRRFAFGFAMTSLFGFAPVQATTTVYLSQASFDAAVANATTAATQYSITNPTTFCYDHAVTCVESTGVTFSTQADSGIYYLNQGSNGNLTSVLSIEGGDISTATITGIGYAFGLTFNSYFDRNGAGVIFTGAGFANLLPVPFQSSGTNFFGVISDGPIGPIKIQSDAQTFDVVSYTLPTTITPPPPPPPSSPAPEAATWAMMVAGFGLLGTVMRRRRPATVRFTA